MYNISCTRLQRMALQLCCGASLALTACTTPTPRPTPAEEPPLMAGEARFCLISPSTKKELQASLAPFLRTDAPVDLWYLANKNRKDDGTFAWCISPAESEGIWIKLGTISNQDLQQLSDQNTEVERGDTLDYWLSFELRSGKQSLSVRSCPAEEFGVDIGSCSSPIRARAFHKLLWQFMDQQYAIQKRFDVVVRN